MPRFSSITFCQNRPKINLILQKKYKIFKRWLLRPQTPATAPLPSLQIYGVRAFGPVQFSYRLTDCTGTCQE